MNRKSLVILGFGGHARSVADVALAAGWAQIVFVDQNAREGEMLGEFAVHSTLPVGWAEESMAFPAAGDNRRREAMCEAAPFPVATLIAPNANVGFRAQIMEGTFVGHMAHVGPQSQIGRGVILNTGCVIEHECSIGEFTHVSVNATVAGRCKIGAHVMLGAGATVIDGVSICEQAIIGAGAVVVDDIVEPKTYVGVPAKPVTPR